MRIFRPAIARNIAPTILRNIISALTGFIVSVVGKGSFVAGQNRELLREMRLRWIEERLAEVVAESKALDVTLVELTEMLRLLYEDGPNA